MKKIISLFFSLVLLTFCSANAYAVDVRVMLSNNVNSSALIIKQGQYAIMDDAQKAMIGTMNVGEGMVCSIKDGLLRIYINGLELPIRSLSFSIVPQSTECITDFNGKLYRDGFTVKYYDDTLVNIINNVEMEHYLYGVVGREMGYGAPMEALKTQAVISRTYAYANIRSTSRYDVAATVSSQVYGGYNEESKTNAAAIKQAVDSTCGIVVLYDGKCFPTYFSANAGGFTENINNVWSGSSSVPFVGVASPYDDDGSASYHWIVNYTGTELKTRADAYAGKDIGDIVDIQITRTDANGRPSDSGRAFKAEIIGTKGSVSAKMDSIRSLLGLRSTLFNVKFEGKLEQIHMKGLTEKATADKTKGLYAMTASGEVMSLEGTSINIIGSTGIRSLGREKVDNISIEGYGYGHGVGLSQDGAIGMAKAGYTYDKIVMHYYFNNELFSFGDLYDSSIVIPIEDSVQYHTQEPF